MRKYFKSSGFTMAEAILVMTILGIIATIMITTMKPAQFKEKGYQILAKQTLADLDTALGMVLTNHCPYGTFDLCYQADSTETFSVSQVSGHYSSSIALGKLLKKYMATSRELAKDWDGYYQNDISSATTNVNDMFKLKNGVVIDIDRHFVQTEWETWIPGEKQATIVNFVEPHYGFIRIDINGEEEPNTLGKDRYRIPLDKYGIAGGE